MKPDIEETKDLLGMLMLEANEAVKRSALRERKEATCILLGAQAAMARWVLASLEGDSTDLHEAVNRVVRVFRDGP